MKSYSQFVSDTNTNKQAQLVPPKADTPIDTRNPAQKLLQLQQLRKQQPNA